VAKLKYSGKTATNTNFIHEEIKCRLASGIACYHSIQYLSLSRLPSKKGKGKAIPVTGRGGP
jgi:hypothetical protein